MSLFIQVAAGEPIGNAITSKCTNHIHFAMKKDEGFVDPTKFLENRLFQYQPWEEDCDDYLLVWKVIFSQLFVVLNMKIKTFIHNEYQFSY